MPNVLAARGHLEDAYQAVERGLKSTYYPQMEDAIRSAELFIAYAKAALAREKAHS